MKWRGGGHRIVTGAGGAVVNLCNPVEHIAMMSEFLFLPSKQTPWASGADADIDVVYV